jgi:hypothetical protein
MATYYDRETLEAALRGFVLRRQEVQAAIDDMTRRLGHTGRAGVTVSRRHAKHRISPEGRERIRQAQIARWAKRKAAEPQAVKATGRKARPKARTAGEES